MLKTQAELDGERAARVAAGTQVPASQPADAEPPRVRSLPVVPRTAIRPGPRAIQPDVLLVNDTALTSAEVLYPLWDYLSKLRSEMTPDVFREEVGKLLQRETRRAIGNVLVEKEALAKLPQARRDELTRSVGIEIEQRIAREFGGSRARFEAQLAGRGLTREQYEKGLTRELVARQYTREKLLPQMQLRRDDLLDHYRVNRERFRSSELRELLLIECPFEAYLPVGQAWRYASNSARAAAKLAAVRLAREAQGALANQPFGEVAKKYCRGPKADEGGSWGMIGKPLQPPFEEISARVFKLGSGQHTEPIETEQGWYIVGCGKIEPAIEPSFAEVQEKIRDELMEERYNRLAAEYFVRLASSATVSSLDTFVEACTRRALTADYTAIAADARTQP